MNNALQDQLAISEEYKIWRKNVPYLYDMMFCHALKWPTLSIQWFPEVKRDEAKGVTTQRLLLSTHTSGKEKEYIQIASIEFPDKYDEMLSEGCHADMRFKITQTIPVNDEANIVRYNPSACNVIAARFDSPDIAIFDYTKHLAYSEEVKEDMVLKGHQKGGFGLCWNSLSFGELATSGEDDYVCIFDVCREGQILESKAKLKKHKSCVNDLCFSYHHQDTLGSVSDDKSIIIWDTRMNQAVSVVNDSHDSDVLSIHFSPINPNLIATGSRDTSVKIWDIRNINEPLSTLLTHTDYVGRVQWSPHSENILASSGKDRRVCIWDLSQVNVPLDVDSQADGPSELMFLHGGHTDNVFDISWNPAEYLEIATVSEDNILQIWQIPDRSESSD